MKINDGFIKVNLDSGEKSEMLLVASIISDIINYVKEKDNIKLDNMTYSQRDIFLTRQFLLDLANASDIIIEEDFSISEEE